MPVFAYGPGSEALGGSIDNTDLFDIVGRALQLTTVEPTHEPR